jgi:hypothetical protein
MGQNSYDSKDRAFVFTEEGKITVAKQRSGLMPAFLGFALVKDNKKWLYKYIRGMSPDGEVKKEKLRNVTYQDILNNCTVVYRGVTYDYDSNQFRPNATAYDKAAANPTSYLFPVYYSYNRYKPDEDVEEEEPMEKTYISYDAYIQPSMLSVTNVTDDMTFDAIIYFASPFNPEEQNRLYGDGQTPVMFAINYFDDDKVMVVKNQNSRLIMNVELHFSMTSYEAKKVTAADYEPFSIHLVNNRVTNTQLKDAKTFSTTDNLLIL